MADKSEKSNKLKAHLPQAEHPALHFHVVHVHVAHRRGWSVGGGVGYDIKQNILQNDFVEISYNGSCCGISFEYRRLSLGPIRTENQFRVSLNIANIGTFGNLRREEKLF